MKKHAYILLTVIILTSITLSVKSQDYIDALRYSKDFYGSTARSAGMGAAFGALGGDFSSLSINPGGLGVYRSSEFTISPSFSTSTVKSNYLGTMSEDNNSNMALSNMGLVLTFPANKESGWINTNLSFGYNKTNYFSENILTHGYNASNSIADYFTQNAKGISPNNLDQFWEHLAFDTYVIDTSMGQYVPNISPGVDQRMAISTTGSSGEYNFGFGANYNNQLYLGASFNITSANYDEENNYYETNTKNVNSDFVSMNFYRSLIAYAHGYNFKAGIIVRPIPSLRIGVAVHSPTFYNIHENYYNSMSSTFNNGTYNAESPDGINEYSLTSPGRLIGSVAYMFQDLALLSVDYEYVDYSSMKLRNGIDGYDYSSENTEINQNMRATNNIRAGVEIKLGTFFIRGGYEFYQSPYSSSDINNNANTNVFTGGVGYHDKNFFIDLAYTYSKLSEDYLMFGPSWPEAINQISESRIITTFGFRF
jgi:hypothetical protein